MTQADRARAFRALHEGPAFLIPNPWDAGSAKVLAGLGFAALATTRSGFAFTLGRADSAATLDEVDLENGHGPAPEDPARAITPAAEAGAVGALDRGLRPGGRPLRRRSPPELRGWLQA